MSQLRLSQIVHQTGTRASNVRVWGFRAGVIEDAFPPGYEAASQRFEHVHWRHPQGSRVPWRSAARIWGADTDTEISPPSSWNYAVLLAFSRPSWVFKFGAWLMKKKLIQGDQKVSVHLTITIQKVTSNVQIVLRHSPDIYWHAKLCSRRPCPALHGSHSECIMWWPSSNHQLF
jgi:hypothetical protein